jgi:hypothetical protein
MKKNCRVPSAVGALAAALCLLLAGPPSASAQASLVTGEATAMRSTVSAALGAGSTTTALGATGALADEADARSAALPTGGIASIGGGNVMHAVAISSINDWSAGEGVASAASLADLSLGIAGSTVSASFVMADAEAPVGAAASGRGVAFDLAVNGVAILASGEENQTISLPGLRLVLNEVRRTPAGITVSALHVSSADGLVDVVIASATAGLAQ